METTEPETLDLLVDAALVDMPPYWKDEALKQWLRAFAEKIANTRVALLG